jgi:hypothetical protein
MKTTYQRNFIAVRGKEKVDLSWIRSNSEKAKRITALLIEEFRGSTLPEDFFAGCYGNPDSDLVLIAEIPSMKPKRIVAEAYSKRLGELWKASWKTTVQDLLLRNALYRNGLVDDPLSDEPWNWGCWITDFVKRAQVTKSWGEMEAHKRERIVKHGAKLLGEELEALGAVPNPVRCVVFVGKEPLRNFDVCLTDREWGFEKKWVYHYSWAKSKSQEEVFFARFKRVVDEYRSMSGKHDRP